MSTNQLEVKIVLIGDSKVGKSSIVKRLIDGSFDANIKPSNGHECRDFQLNVNNKNFKLHIYDISGKPQLRELAAVYYRDAHIIIAVYDATNKQSQNSLEGWLNDVADKNQGDYTILIAGNKSDLNGMSESKSPSSVITKLCGKYQCNHVFVSAFENLNIEVN